MAQIEGFLTVKEAAELLNVSGGRIRQLITEKRISSIKVGQMRLIKEIDLELVRERPNGRPPKDKSKE